MRKIISTFIAAIVVAIVMSPAAQAITWKQRWGQDRFRNLYAPSDVTSVGEARWTVEAAADLFGVNQRTMMCIANRESHFHERSYNPSSGASGLFQHLRRYWPSRVSAYNSVARAHRPWLVVSSNVFIARANALVTAWMIKNGGLGPWGGGC